MRLPNLRSLRRRRRALRGRITSPLLLATVAVAVLAAPAGASAATHPTVTAAPVAWTAATATIAPGVTVGGIAVGGLTEAAATDAVRLAWTQTPVTVRLVGATYTATTAAAGQVVYAAPAAHTAFGVGRGSGPAAPAPGATLDVPLRVEVRDATLDGWVATTAAKVDHAAVDASYKLVNKRPKITRERDGYAVDRTTLRRAIKAALLSRTATRAIAAGPKLALLQATHAKVTAKTLPQVIVIDRTAHKLYLYSPRRLVHVWGVAVGRAQYPTPLGTFRIVTKQKDPTWTPPDSDWAQGEKPIGPGPDNPLGTRWMGLSAPGIGIHGTNSPASIGYSASHGCVRMRIPDAEQLFSLVAVGTPVHIVK